jgi:hypothetical protein
MWAWITRKGLKFNFNTLPRPWSLWGASPARKNSHSRTGNRTRNLMPSSQKFWPPSHEACHIKKYKRLIRDIQAEEFMVTVADWRTESFAIKFPTSPSRYTWNSTTLEILSEMFAAIRKHLQGMIFVLERNSEEHHILCIYPMTSLTMFSKTWTNIMSSPIFFILTAQRQREFTSRVTQLPSQCAKRDCIRAYNLE